MVLWFKKEQMLALIVMEYGERSICHFIALAIFSCVYVSRSKCRRRRRVGLEQEEKEEA